MFVPSGVGTLPGENRPPRCVHAFGPIQFLDKRRRVKKLALGAVENIKITIPVGLHQKVLHGSVFPGIDQDRSFSRIVVIQIVRRELKVPLQFPVSA